MKEFVEVLPEHDFLYLGDNARSPYGIRSFDTIFDYTLQSIQYLFSQGCPLIILACNTASAKALKNVQMKVLPTKADPSLRVLGVIRPTAEAIGEMTQTGHVGILATKGTVSSRSYELEANKLFPSVKVYQEACPMWVPLVENREIDSSGARYFIERNLNNLMAQSNKIDTVLLGCTHYPLLYPVIREYLPERVRIIDQGEIVAESLNDYLYRHPEIDMRCSRGGEVHYLTTGASEDFDSHASDFLGQAVSSVRVDTLDAQTLIL